MPGFTTGVTVGWAEMCEGFMRLVGTIPADVPEAPGLTGGAAIVDAELEYLFTGFSGFWGLRLVPSLASFFLSLFSCLTSFSYLRRVENTSVSSVSAGLEMTAGAEYSLTGGA